MIKKILIANRGEIASRIIRTCKKLNIKTVTIYSWSDKNFPFQFESDEAYSLGENSEAKETYLNQEKIISIAKESGADAIHPGYGFLSENSIFAKKVIDAGLIFIGPSPESILLMGDKVQSRIHVEKISVPIIPGINQKLTDEELLAEVKKIGFPVLIKASAGGGGKGMKKVFREEEFFENLNSARREAKNFFSNEEVFIEKLIEEPRHIEIQIFGDSHGSVYSILERDCSVQRRHQKIIEECPAPNFSEVLRKKMSETAIKIGKSISYLGAGTVEFILDKDLHFYFMEMNTRLQVEHPVTEMVTGLDLVELQIKVANGEKLELENFIPNKHSIELRVYAENPEKNFLPEIGKIQFLNEANDLRIDSGIQAENEISIYYDPMISKLISVGKTREDAITSLNQSLEKYVIFGLNTNLSYLKFILNHEEFLKGKFSTSYIDSNLENFTEENHYLLVLTKIFQIINSTYSTKSIHEAILKNSKFKFILKEENLYKELNILYKEKNYKIKFDFIKENKIHLEILVDEEKHFLETYFLNDFEFNGRVLKLSGKEFFLQSGIDLFYFKNGSHYKFQLVLEESSESSDKDQHYKSPMPGKLTKLFIKQNEEVKKGQVLAVVEAMKMENLIKAKKDSTVKEIYFKEGDLVSADQILFNLD